MYKRQVYLHVEEEDRSPCLDGFKYLDVEVLIDVSKLGRQADVVNLFQSYHSKLHASNMTTDHLGAFMISYDEPLPTTVITQFGLQPNGLFVAGNCAFGNGDLYSHEEAKVAIVPKYFEDQIMPLPRRDYPQHIIITQPFVRYTIGMNAWSYIMPSFFG